MRVWGQNRERGGAILTPNELVLPFGGSYDCANFGENRSRNATVRVPPDGQIHTLTDANRFYNLSHAICYSYGTDNDDKLRDVAYHSVLAVHKKNCDPFVFLPALAIDRIPAQRQSKNITHKCLTCHVTANKPTTWLVSSVLTITITDTKGLLYTMRNDGIVKIMMFGRMDGRG